MPPCTHTSSGSLCADCGNFACAQCGMDCQNCSSYLCDDCFDIHVCEMDTGDSGAEDPFDDSGVGDGGVDDGDFLIDTPTGPPPDGLMTLAWMAGELLRAEDQSLPIVVDDPQDDLPDPLDDDDIVIPNDVTVISEPPPPRPKRFPFRTLLWNIANLGGKFGYPPVRDQSVIDAIARILHTADADVITILEVLHKSGSGRAPKEPEKLLSALDEVLRLRKKQKRDLVLGIVGRWFATRVHNAIWPGANVDMTSLDNQARGHARDADSLDVALAEAWNEIEATVVAWKPNEPDPDDTNVLTSDGDGEDGDSDVEPDVTAIPVKKSIFRKRKRGPDDTYLNAAIPILVAEGYAHFFDKFSANYKSKKNDEEEENDDDEQALSEEEQKARDYVCKKALGDLRAAVLRVWSIFLQSLAQTDFQPEKDGDLWPLLAATNYDARLAEYLRRKAEWDEEQKQRKAGNQHDGVSEFLRIRDALNLLAGDAYDASPAAPPDEGTVNFYTRGETYGILWKKAKFTAAAPQYVGDFTGKAYDKRQPIRIALTLVKRNDAPPLHVVAWHPPAPSKTNTDARIKDFPTFIRYCQEERKEKRLGILLSDLNVNTVTNETTVEHTNKKLAIGTLFNGICGTNFDLRAFDAQLESHSTLVVTKVRPAPVDSVPKTHSMFPFMTELRTRLEGVPRAKYILDNIDSYIAPPQVRYGASAYDKILPICRRSGEWTLWQKTTYVIPFPHAVALPEEAPLFRDPQALAAPVRPFAMLLANTEPVTLTALRKYARQDSPAKSIKRLMVVARKLSDHMPLVSNWELADGDLTTVEEQEEVEVPVILLPDPEPESTGGLPSKLEELAKTYESSSPGEAREEALSVLLVWFNETWQDDSAPKWAVSRLERAMQNADRSEDRKKEEDSDKRQSSRPQLPSESKRAPVVVETLQQRLSANGESVRANAGGGDCLFRSIAQLVFGDEEQHGAVRQAVVNHLEDLLGGGSLDDGGAIGPVTAAEFAERMEHLLDWHAAEWRYAAPYRRVHGIDRWRQYILAMSRPGEWGDLIALSAASHLFGTRFLVYARVGGNRFYTDLVDFVDREILAVPQVSLLNSGNYHFEAVAPAGRFEVRDPELGAPLGWERLTPQRDRVVVVEPPPPQEKKVGTTTTTSEPPPAKGSGTKPVLGTPVCRWPDTIFWDLLDPFNNPRALFLFGENDVARGTKQFQSSTQACIRPADNAHGIRTCWKPGADPREGGAMLDGELGKNTAAIDEDFADAKAKLLTGKYTTLVVPWNMKSDQVALGTGVARLDTDAPQTYAHLAKCTTELTDWASKCLHTVIVCPRETSLMFAIAAANPSSIFIDEVIPGWTDWMRSFGSTNLYTLPNVFPVSTARNYFGWQVGDTHLEKSRELLTKEFIAIADAVRSGRYRRLVYPANQNALGVATDLVNASPLTYQHLQACIVELERICLTVDTSKVDMPELKPPPTNPAIVDDEDSDDDEVSPSKRRRTK